MGSPQEPAVPPCHSASTARAQWTIASDVVQALKRTSALATIQSFGVAPDRPGRGTSARSPTR